MSVDQVDAAIAAAQEPKAVAMREFQVTISSTGRPAAVVLPVDASDAELAEFSGWLLTQVMGTYRQERVTGPASRLVVPRHIGAI